MYKYQSIKRIFIKELKKKKEERFMILVLFFLSLFRLYLQNVLELRKERRTESKFIYELLVEFLRFNKFALDFVGIVVVEIERIRCE